MSPRLPAPFALLLVLAACVAGGCSPPKPAGGTGGEHAAGDGAAHGVVLLVDGTPAVGATVTLGGQAPVVVGADGTFAFRDLAPGPYGLEVFLEPYRTERRSRLPIAAGRDLEVPPVVLMRITAIDADRLAAEVGRSDDGRSLLFGAGHDPRRHRVDAWFWADTGEARRIDEGLDESLLDEYRRGDVSPDGRYVVYQQPRADSGDPEVRLVEGATGAGRSLGFGVRSIEFAADGSRLTYLGRSRADGSPVDLRAVALPSLEETVLCQDSNGVVAVGADPERLVCGDGRRDMYPGDTPDLVRWDLGAMASAPLAGNARIVCIDPALDRALVLVGDGPGPYAVALWRIGEDPVTLAEGVEPDGAACDAGAEKGFLVAGGSLVRVDLLAGSTRVLDSDVVAVRPAPSMEQAFYFKGRELPDRRLFTWDERSDVATELVAGVPDNSFYRQYLANDWPRWAAFVARADGAYPETGDLYLLRFDRAEPPRRIAAGAAIVRLDQAGFVFFHDVDGAGVGSLSVLGPAEEATPLALEGIRFSGQHEAWWPRLAPGLDRVLAFRPGCGSGPETVAWDREHGAVPLGGTMMLLDPSFARVVAFAAADGDAGPGVLRLFDFDTGELRTLSDRALLHPFASPDLARIGFLETTESGELSLRFHDHATGTTRMLLSPAVAPSFAPNRAFTHALIGSGPRLTQELFLADLATGRVEPVGATADSAFGPCDRDGNRCALVDEGSRTEPHSARLLLIDLPAMAATVLDEAAAPAAPWVNDDFSAIVYRRDLVEAGPDGEAVGDLWARALRPDAVSYRVDGNVRGVVLATAGSFLYEVAGQGIRAGVWPR